MESTSVSESPRSLGNLLLLRRQELGLTQVEVATSAGISTSYYSSLENLKCLPPTRNTLRRILAAIKVSAMDAQQAEELAAIERGIALIDINLPEEAQGLITDIRKHANALSPRFFRGLRSKIREVIT